MVSDVQKGISAACLMVGVALTGCSGEYKPPPPSDLAVAKESLEKSLNLWRSKVTPMELQAAAPPIIVSDDDWDADHRLLEFHLLPGEVLAGNSIRWPVRLRVAKRDGREEELEVTYVISTNPLIHIRRQD